MKNTFCQKCGRRLDEGTRFCDLCGTPTGVGAPNQQPQYRQPQYQQPQQAYQPPRQTPAKPKSKGPIIAVILAAVVLVIGVAVFALAMMGRTTFGEEFELQDWNWCEIICNDVDYGIIRKADTNDTGCIDDVWVDLMDTNMRATKKDLKEEIRSGNYEDLYLTDESGDIWLWVAVTAEGDMFAEYCGEVTCYTGAKELYEKLDSYIFFADSASLEGAISATGWAGMAIYLDDSNGEPYDSAFTTDPVVTADVVSELRELEVKYGGGLSYAPSGFRITLQLWDENDNYLYIYVYDDGNADIPFGDWTYGVYDAVDLYELLIDSMTEITLLQG